MKTKKLVLTALTIALFSGSAAFAGGGGKSNNGNGRGASDNGRNTNGAIASELKWRNAGHASAQAFLNANENSSVGQLATFKTATQAVLDLYAAAGLDPDVPLRDPALIEADIASVEVMLGLLDPLSPTYDPLFVGDAVALAEQLEALEAELQFGVDIVEPLAAEAEAAEVVGVDGLTDAAIDALWDLLEGK